jgi:hypothetical protein
MSQSTVSVVINRVGTPRKDTSSDRVRVPVVPRKKPRFRR